MKKAWIYDAATSWISFMKHISNKEEEDMSNQIYHYEGLATQIDRNQKPNIHDLRNLVELFMILIIIYI